MKIKTVIEKRFEKTQIKKPINKVIIIILLLVQLMFNTIFPFALGVYFALTKHIFFLVLMLFPLLFDIKIKITKNNNINFEITRGV